jgi:HEAT repeat protein
VRPIQEIIQGAEYRPELLKQAATALGLLGDRKLVGELIEMLKSAKGLYSQAALASALGTISDARSLDLLTAMLESNAISDRARGCAAAALGIVCDKEVLSWNSKISVGINYRANTTTLTGYGGTGFLDILYAASVH